ncbi:MAG: ParA family protein [Rhodocyclaceae bacterium]|nr:ParA family protein [Rhodocyclaceae bacterium]
MRSILVINPKGGAGKTTLSTNVAAYLARKGERVAIGDLDRQQSAMAWLDFRDEALPRIEGFDARDGWDSRPKGTQVLVIDAPAGIHGGKLSESLKAADKVLVPVQPSLFDMAATEEFLRLVAEEKSVRKHKTFVALVAMRVDPRTRTAAMLERFLTHFELPVLTYLRDTQIYPAAAAEGKSLFDIAPSRARRELENWQPLTAWIDS